MLSTHTKFRCCGIYGARVLIKNGVCWCAIWHFIKSENDSSKCRWDMRIETRRYSMVMGTKETWNLLHRPRIFDHVDMWSFSYFANNRSGAGVGGFLVSWFLGSLVSWLLGFLVSWFFGFLVSWFLGFKVCWFLGFKVSWFPSSLDSWLFCS